MAKRLFSILLLFLYLIPSIGVSGSVHYCGGEIAAIVIIPSDEHPCACGPNEPADGGCCQDKAFSIKIYDTYKSANAKIILGSLGDYALVHQVNNTLELNVCPLEKKASFRVKEKDPPDQKLFTLYESYLI